MPDLEKVIWDIGRCISHEPDACRDCSQIGISCMEDLLTDALALLKEQENIINSLNSDLNETLDVVSGRLNVVRCKDCIHRGKSEKCVLAAISEEKDYPLFMLDNRGEWFCADGKRAET